MDIGASAHDLALIVDKLTQYLDSPRFANLHVELVGTGIRKDGDWWYVPVRRTEQTPRTYEYYDLLASVEQEIEDQDHINVMLVPSA